MIEEMKLRNFSPRTEQSYLGAMIGLVKHYRRSPDQLTKMRFARTCCTSKGGACLRVRATWPSRG